MLGVISHKLRALEDKVEENAKQLQELRQHLTFCEEDSPVANGAGRVHLFKLQTQLKRVSFQLNSVFLKICKHERELMGVPGNTATGNQTKLDLQEHSSNCQVSNQNTYNPFANEFFPRMEPQHVAYENAEQSLYFEHAEKAEVDDIPNDQEMAELALQETSMLPSNDACVPILTPIPMVTSLGNSTMFTAFPEKANLAFKSVRMQPVQHENVVPDLEQQPNVSLQATQQIAEAGSSHVSSFDAEELASCRESIQLLEQELEVKERKIQDIASRQATGNDHASCQEREKELIEKQEWYEHKLRLLKQDKRRRGETIGKLIRCIDELRDAGRLDEAGRAFDAQLVLAAALASRGWQPEQRIQATVHAMETERANQRAMVTGSYSPGTMVTNPFNHLQSPGTDADSGNNH